MLSESPLFFHDFLLPVLDVDAVSRNVLNFLAAEIIGGFIGRASHAYRLDIRTGVVLCERVTLSVVGPDLQGCWREFLDDEMHSVAVINPNVKLIVI